MSLVRRSSQNRPKPPLMTPPTKAAHPYFTLPELSYNKVAEEIILLNHQTVRQIIPELIRHSKHLLLKLHGMIERPQNELETTHQRKNRQLLLEYPGEICRYRFLCVISCCSFSGNKIENCLKQTQIPLSMTETGQGF